MPKFIEYKNKAPVFYAITVTALAIFLGLFALSRANNDNEITACVNRIGNIRLVGAEFGTTECRKNEKKITWNMQGTAGPKGDKGDPGSPSWDETRVAALEAGVAALEALHTEEPEVSVAIVKDNFNSYTDGSVIGQGGWVEYKNGANFLVQGAVTNEGAKALHVNATADSVVTKTGTPRANGQQAVYVRTENRAGWGAYADGNAQIRVLKGGWGGSDFAAVSFKSSGDVAYYDKVANKYQIFAVYNDNEWTLLEIEWRASDKSARYRVGNGAWTDWHPIAGSGSFTDFDNVGFDFINFSGGTGGVYFDTLQ